MHPGHFCISGLGIEIKGPHMFRNSFKTLLMVSVASMACTAVYAQETPPEEQEETRQLNEVVIVGRFIPDEKRATSEISSLIDSEDFKVTGDPDAASALRRVTGLTISRGKFVFVRGLNERYSNASLNGSPLPSPEPLRRVAPLDLFPTSVLDSVLVQKTWSPEFSAEFGGGLIQLRTKAVPDQGFFEINASGTANTVTSFQDGLLYEGGGNSDFTGFDDGTRNLPPILEDIFRTARVNTLSAEDNAAAGAGLIDPSLIIAQEGTVGPNLSFSLSGGQRFDVSRDISLGVTATAGYNSAWDTRRGVRRAINVQNINPDGSSGNLGAEGVASTLTIDDDFARESTENNIKLNALVGLGLDAYDNHEVALTGLITRSTSREVRVFEGFEDDIGNDIREENFEFFERQLFTLQGRGEHVFPVLGNIWGELDDFQIDWRASYSEAFRDAPFQSQVTFEEDGGTLPTVIDGTLQLEDVDDVSITFSEIDDDTRDVGVDFTLPLSPSWLPGREAEFSAGYAHFASNRDTFTRIFNFGGALPPALAGGRIDAIFNESTITGNPATGFVLEEVGGSQFPEAFQGSLSLDAFYFAGDIRITDNFRIAGGVRFEDAVQTSDTFNLTLPDNGIIEAEIASDFVLPSVTATWNILENVQLRGAYSQTITRPQFRELAFVQFINSETDENFLGNPFLVNSRVDNFDARLEWYFGREQFLTVGGFFKDLENPIEEVGASSLDSPINTFINAPAAQIFGFEFEYQQTVPLHDWLKWAWLADRDFVVKTNYSFTNSEVSADGDVLTASFNAGAIEQNVIAGQSFIIDGRRLQGQSDHVVNVQLGYDNIEAGSSLRVLFNFASDRIRTTESLVANQPAIIEQPPLSLDLTYSREFDFRGGMYTLALAAKNLTGADYSATQSGTENSIIVDSFDRGQQFSISLKRGF
jgi:TonB-dependent receptor